MSRIESPPESSSRYAVTVTTNEEGNLVYDRNTSNRIKESVIHRLNTLFLPFAKRCRDDRGIRGRRTFIRQPV